VTVTTRLQSLRPSLSRPADPLPAEPVTVTVARVVRPEQQNAFERWAADVQELVATFPGHLGSSLLRPGPGSDEFHLVYRFRDSETLSAWERSTQRREALDRVSRLVEDERTARAVGLESFFAVPAQPGPPWRSWLLTVAVVLALTSSFQLIAVPFVGHWPWGSRLLLSAAYVVSALRVLMPRLSRRLGAWLQGPAAADSAPQPEAARRGGEAGRLQRRGQRTRLVHRGAVGLLHSHPPERTGGHR
jgi:antibiotic biosynthesis monooxygenase (ABM) superfamily enzyme